MGVILTDSVCFHSFHEIGEDSPANRVGVFAIITESHVDLTEAFRVFPNRVLALDIKHFYTP